MTGPKHLWSGDWERESARTAQRRAEQPLPDFSSPAELGPADDAAAVSRRWGRRQIGIALASSITAAAVAAVLVLTLGGGSKTPAGHRLASATTGQRTSPQLRSSTPPQGQTIPQTCQQNPAACTPTSTSPTATPSVTGPSASWLGMQIVTSPDGVVISTVSLGSPADMVGLNPGDEITGINGRPITSVRQIRSDTAGLPLGSQVTIRVQRASVMVQLSSLPMTERPTIHP